MASSGLNYPIDSTDPSFWDRIRDASCHELEEWTDAALTVFVILDLQFRQRFPGERRHWIDRVKILGTDDINTIQAS